MATSTSLNTHTSASARTQSHWLSSLGKEMGFQQRSDRKTGVLLGALRYNVINTIIIFEEDTNGWETNSNWKQTFKNNNKNEEKLTPTNAPTGDRTLDLRFTRPTPYHLATEAGRTTRRNYMYNKVMFMWLSCLLLLRSLWPLVGFFVQIPNNYNHMPSKLNTQKNTWPKLILSMISDCVRAAVICVREPATPDLHNAVYEVWRSMCLFRHVEGPRSNCWSLWRLDTSWGVRPRAPFVSSLSVGGGGGDVGVNQCVCVF